jgi:fatty-acyl-CoA synthase
MGMSADGQPFWLAEPGTIPLLNTTIGDLLDERAAALPDQEAKVYSCYPELGPSFDIRWTYAEYQRGANAVAKGLIALGLQKGDHIAILATNVPDWAVPTLAAARLLSHAREHG